MVIGALKVRLKINGARSLKAKRKILKPLKDRLGHMNISIAEVEDQDIWQASTLGIAMVSNDSKYVNSRLDKVMEYIYQNADAEVIESCIEIVHI
ncbi:MAG: DUF503 domain-containing protein [Deltaproteobacteria bacterium]|nr:DUF503 domain-containing protein [Deltaproteobacteria bacterium]